MVGAGPWRVFVRLRARAGKEGEMVGDCEGASVPLRLTTEAEVIVIDLLSLSPLFPGKALSPASPRLCSCFLA